MKKLITLTTVAAIGLQSCITTRITNVPNSSTIAAIDRSNIEILGPVEGNAGGGRVWVTFIPIGWGNTAWVKSAAYKAAIKEYPNADGLLDQVITYKRWRVPLLIVTPVGKSAKVTGTAYRIKSDQELLH